MNLRRLRSLPAAALVAFASALSPSAHLVLAQPQAAREVVLEDDQIFTRGPVHEAFAGIQQLEPSPGLVINSRPQEQVNELPPEQRPEGDHVAWIPGYWMWDDVGEHFLWVSGVWRVIPPGRQWIPGYWHGVDTGWQWISGYWFDTGRREVVYLPQPPAPLEAGPNSPAPSPRHAWQPGNWEWQEEDWRWRTGFWLKQREDYLWVPASYCWTPRGCIFVSGYWDYVVPRRGIVFCPVRFVSRPNWEEAYWRPRVVVNIEVFYRDIFVRPRNSHYYFGDYYEDRYRAPGFIEPYVFAAERGGWDPIFHHQRWRHRDDENWTRQYIEGYRYRASHPESRPPGTWREARDWRGRGPQGEPLFVAAQRLDELAEEGASAERFRRLDKAERERYAQMSEEFDDFRGTRDKLESCGPRRGPPLDERRESSRIPEDPERRDERPDVTERREPKYRRVQRGTIPESPVTSQEKPLAGKRDSEGQQPERPQPEVRAPESRSPQATPRREPPPSPPRPQGPEGADRRSAEPRPEPRPGPDRPRSPGHAGEQPPQPKEPDGEPRREQ